MDEGNPLLKKWPTINPYYRGGEMILRRLLWDMNPKSWISRRKLARLKNCKRGEKAVILCNGPSLNKVDFDLIERNHCSTFGLNKINLLFDRTSFRPDYIVAVNQFVLEQNSEFYNSTNIPLFLDSYSAHKKLVRMRQNIVFLHSGPNGFARDCSMSVSQGHTVTYVAMQLAFHMGFESVALVGCDHNFAVAGPANKTVVSGEIDESHFDSNYFAGGEKWQLPDLFESEVAYQKARNVYEAFGRKIVNATEGGRLDIFERTSLMSFLKQ